jgi:hypothetical protein
MLPATYSHIPVRETRDGFEASYDGVRGFGSDRGRAQYACLQLLQQRERERVKGVSEHLQRLRSWRERQSSTSSPV